MKNIQPYIQLDLRLLILINKESLKLVQSYSLLFNMQAVPGQKGQIVTMDAAAQVLARCDAAG